MTEATTAALLRTRMVELVFRHEQAAMDMDPRNDEAWAAMRKAREELLDLIYAATREP